MSNYCKEHGSKTDFCVSDCDELNGIHLKELNQSPIMVIEGGSRYTVFYDSNGDEYLRVGADNVPADVYERFTSWCMHLPPVHDADVRRLTDENEAMREQLKHARGVLNAYGKHNPLIQRVMREAQMSLVPKDKGSDG